MVENRDPLVSIVIPTYNQKHPFLRECIESAINQTYRNTEIVISDNHSTNGASEIIASYARGDNRIRVIKPSTHLSLVPSQLFAADHASGKYFGILSSDDMILPTCVEELVPVLERNLDVVFAHGEAIHFTPDGKETLDWEHFDLRSGIYSFEDGMEKFIEHRYTYMAGQLIRTDVFRKIENPADRATYSTRMTYAYDTYLLFRMLEVGKVGYVGHPLARIRVENEARERNNALQLLDFSLTYAWLEQSRLVDRIPNCRRTLSRVKTNVGFSGLRRLVYKRVNGVVTDQEYRGLVPLANKLISRSAPLKKMVSEVINWFPWLPIRLLQCQRRMKLRLGC